MKKELIRLAVLLALIVLGLGFLFIYSSNAQL